MILYYIISYYIILYHIICIIYYILYIIYYVYIVCIYTYYISHEFIPQGTHEVIRDGHLQGVASELDVAIPQGRRGMIPGRSNTGIYIYIYGGFLKWGYP